MKRLLSLLLSLLLFTSSIFAGSFGHADIDDHADHLKAYWRTEETGAAARVDDVGSNDLTANNTPGNRAGISNDACDFIKTSSESLSVSSGADLIPTTGFVCSMWVEHDQTGTEQMMWGISDGVQSQYIYRESSGNNSFRIVQSDDAAKALSFAEELSAAIHHVVFMACDGYLRAYVDSVEQGTPTAYDNTIHASTTFYIGAYAGATHWMDGLIDEIGWWKDINFANQAEREAFVTAIYNSGTGRFYGTETAPVKSNLMTAGVVQNKVTAGTINKIYTAQ